MWGKVMVAASGEKTNVGLYGRCHCVLGSSPFSSATLISSPLKKPLISCYYRCIFKGRQDGNRRAVEREHKIQCVLVLTDDRWGTLNERSIPEPVKIALNIIEVPVSILQFAGAIYPAGACAKSPTPYIPSGESDESWQPRSGLFWTWRTTRELNHNGAPSHLII